MKKQIKTAAKPLLARVIIPGSKSLTNRALLLAALASGESFLSGILFSDDTYALIHALCALGVDLQVDEVSRTCRVTGCGGQFPAQQASIHCRDAGTVARFLLAACAVSRGRYVFDASTRLRERPIADLLRVLRAQGAQINAEKMPFSMEASGLQGGMIEVSSTETSQFLSALLMISPFAKQSVLLKTNEVVSAPYVEMTCQMMSDFGVHVERVSQSDFAIAVPQQYQARDYVIEPDLSTASYFFAAAAVTGGCVTIQPLTRKQVKQGDVAFLNVLEAMGCQVIEHASGLRVQGPKKLQGVTVNMQDFSDTFMTLAAIAPFAETPTTITHIGHTRHQESDRISAMRKNLEALRVKVEEGADWIKVYPSEPQGGLLNSYQDHRIAMACSLIGLRVPGIEIEDAECVAKTCPTFFEMWESVFL
jgi:3-phosphoshikimate 1-carboxyvinyltransferase